MKARVTAPMVATVLLILAAANLGLPQSVSAQRPRPTPSPTPTASPTPTPSPTPTSPPDSLVCSPDTNGGQLVNGVCVLPGANVGQNYEGFILTSNNSGGTFFIASGSLPPGLSMPSSYGASGTIVAGTPSQEGTFTFTVKGTDSHGQPLQQTYSIKVDPPLPLTISSGPCCPDGNVGTPYEVNFFSNGGAPPVSWSIASGQLPAGIGFCGTPPAKLQGLPTVAGTSNFTVEVTDSRGTHTSEAATITVHPTTSTPDSQSLSPACVRGGLSSTGTVRLSHPAPASGMVVTLSSDKTYVATVPSQITIPAGSTNATFTVNTQPVSGVWTVTVAAMFDGQYFSAGLTVTPS